MGYLQRGADFAFFCYFEFGVIHSENASFTYNDERAKTGFKKLRCCTVIHSSCKATKYVGR